MCTFSVFNNYCGLELISSSEADDVMMIRWMTRLSACTESVLPHCFSTCHSFSSSTQTTAQNPPMGGWLCMDSCQNATSTIQAIILNVLIFSYCLETLASS